MKPVKLNTEPKIKTGFTVPEGYFESFSEELMNQIKETDSKVIPLKSKLLIRLSVAASVALFLGLGTYFYVLTKSESDYSEQIEMYLTSNTQLTTHDIVSFMEYSDVSSLEAKHNLQPDEIEGFLLDNYEIDEIITHSTEN
ncbi:hypothetical protein [Flavobacterium sp.]|uniref:hypothetical protein n=1 Tax=Flavobacterium sp. TaxID=239 RepID=UPI002FDB5D32